MNALRICLLAITVIFLLIAGQSTAWAAKEEGAQRTAFVRGGDLWVKTGNKERQLAKGPFVRTPKCSFDGEWIAYTKGEVKQSLWVQQVRTGRSSLVAEDGGPSFQWSPNANKLAFQMTELLQYIDVSQPDKPLGAAKGLDSYSWLPSGARLAYIGGVGREASSNKQLKVVGMKSEKSVTYTPTGYVDQSFAWQGVDRIVVSRAAESKGASGAGEREKPYLVAVELGSGVQSQLTKPEEAYGDYYPVSLKRKLAWVRYASGKAHVVVADGNGGHAVVWINTIDPVSDYYEQWHWSEVLQFFKPIQY